MKSLVNHIRVTTVFVLVGISAAIAHAEVISVPASDRDTDVQFLRSLGLTVPDSGVVLESPYRADLTNQSLIVPTQWIKSTTFADKVSAAALRRDLPILKTALERGYIGWELAASRGWDWEQTFANWDAALASAPADLLADTEGFAPLITFKKSFLDNHFIFGVKAAFSIVDPANTVYFTQRVEGNCTTFINSSGTQFPLDPSDRSQQPRTARLAPLSTDGTIRAVSYLSIPSHMGIGIAVICNGESIPVVNSANAGRDATIAQLEQELGVTADVPVFRQITSDVAYVRFPTFSVETGIKIKALKDALPTTAGSERVVVIDFRANGGGDNPPAVDFLGRWVDVTRIADKDIMTRHVKESCITKALKWGDVQNDLKNVTPPLPDGLRQDFQQELDKVLSPSAPGCPVTFSDVHTDWNYSKHQYNAHSDDQSPTFIVLTDRGCASDCEGLVYILAQLPKTVIAGENTFGMIQFVQPGVVLLPNSRVLVGIPRGESDIYGDRRAFDGYGLNVDLLLPSTDTQKLSYVFDFAKRLAANPSLE